MFGMKDPPYDVDLFEWQEKKMTKTKRKIVDISDTESEASHAVRNRRESTRYLRVLGKTTPYSLKYLPFLARILIENPLELIDIKRELIINKGIQLE